MKLINEQIQYVEFLSEDFASIRQFYSKAFGWEFIEYGQDYLAFTGENVDGGFSKGKPVLGSIMPVVYSSELEATKERVNQADGKITKEIFSFPGGCRFEFTYPDGNKLAAWSELKI